MRGRGSTLLALRKSERETKYVWEAGVNVIRGTIFMIVSCLVAVVIPAIGETGTKNAIRPEVSAALDSLKSRCSVASTQFGDSGYVEILQGVLSEPVEGDSFLKTAMRFLDENRVLFGLIDPAGELIVRREEHSAALGTHHIHFQQTFRDLPVRGSELSLHFSKQRQIKMINSHISQGISVDVNPSISKAQASHLAANKLVVGFLDTGEGSGDLIIYKRPPRDYRLAWHVLLAMSQEVFVDAHTGEILQHGSTHRN